MNHSKNPFILTTPPKGFTLVEVLVAVLVLSIGLLGLASLQATSLRNNSDASIQTRASYIASDMADRIRANGSQAGAYPTTAPATVTGGCVTGTCTPTQMVQNDLAEWNALVQTLPAGQGAITTLAGGLFTITVRWDEARNGATGTGCNPDDPTDLRCLSLTTQP